MSELNLTDHQDVLDLSTFCLRAQTLDPTASDPAVRLQATGRVLAVWTGVMFGQGLTAPLALGMRSLALAVPSKVDLIVQIRAVLDRTARMENTQETIFTLPPVQIRAQWAGITPPRSGWQPLGLVPADDQEHLASITNAQIAETFSKLGFTETGKATVYQNGNWRRITSTKGHLLFR